MGTLRYWTDGTGEDHELSDHEGFVQSEIDITNPLSPENGPWVAYWGSELVGHFTGRHRPSCDCGWRGPVADLDFRDSLMMDDDLYSALMEAWDRHADEVIATLVDA